MAHSTDDTYSAMKDTKLWVKISAIRMPRLSELEMATTILRTAQDALGAVTFVANNILGVQYMNAYKAWIVYARDAAAKGMILSLNSISIGNATYPVCDFSQVGLRTKSLRISIHGIPQHVDDSEIEQWLDEHMVRETEVQKAKVKGTENSPFSCLYSGNRFCYATRVFKDIPRFTTFTMTDPEDPVKLVDSKVVIYYEGQPINSRICQSPDHEVEDCPNRNFGANQRCHKCGQLGHVKRDCPASLGMHYNNYELATGVVDLQDNMHTPAHQTQPTPVSEPLMSEQHQQRTPSETEEQDARARTSCGVPAELAQEIIDHLLIAKDGDTAPSPPELMDRVQLYLDAQKKPQDNVDAASACASITEDHEQSSVTSSESSRSTKEEERKSKKRKEISPLDADKKASKNKSKGWFAKKLHKNTHKSNAQNDTCD